MISSLLDFLKLDMTACSSFEDIPNNFAVCHVLCASFKLDDGTSISASVCSMLGLLPTTWSFDRHWYRATQHSGIG